MAKRKPARAKAARNAAPKSRSRKGAARPRRAAAKKSTSVKTRKTARGASARKVAAKKAKKKVARASARKASAQKRAPARKAAQKRAQKRAPTLDRARRSAVEEEMVPSPPSSLNPERRASSSVRSGRRDLRDRLREHTSTGPAMTAGDIDADWESADSVGDEAPGGDNPTPDQDVVDDIGRALGVEYDDDEELKGGDEISARDKRRWELDPASSDDYDERD